MFLLLNVMQTFAPSSILATRRGGDFFKYIQKRIVALLFLVVGPGAPNSVLAPSSDALAPSRFLFLTYHQSVRPLVPVH